MSRRHYKLTRPAQIGGTVFHAGVSERLVIDRAQREYVYQQKPPIEAKRIRRLQAFLNKLHGVTSWYPKGTHPTRKGYYERRYCDGIYMHYWDGKVWRADEDSPPHWRQVTDYPEWRGLKRSFGDGDLK